MKSERDEKEALGQVINDYIRDRLRSGHRQSANYAHSLITLGWQARAEYGEKVQPELEFCDICEHYDVLDGTECCYSNCDCNHQHEKAEVCECGHEKDRHKIDTGAWYCWNDRCPCRGFRPVQPAEDADKPGADAPECESCGSTLIASDPQAVTDGEPLLCVKCVKQEISMGDTKHDPYCDCGICQYCGGDEDVYGNPTTAHKRPDIRAESCRPYQRAARELRRLFPIEIRYNCDFEAFVKRLEKGEL